MKTIHTQTQQVAIIGVGGTGAAVLDNLAVACEGEHRTVAIDTDALALRGTVAAKRSWWPRSGCTGWVREENGSCWMD